jgi:hypothetical protein
MQRMKRSEVMKISSILSGLLAYRAGNADADGADWIDDPYAHPVICAMSERERADLPPIHLPAATPALRSGALPRVLRISPAACA